MVAKKNSVKKKPNRRTRRKHTEAFKNKVVRYALDNSLKASSEKYDVHVGMVSRWRDDGFGKVVRRKNRKVSKVRKVAAVDAQDQLQAELRALREENAQLKNAAIKLLLTGS